MKVLLTDGSGLTARQTATRLASAGHHVEALAPDSVCLCRFTRHVRRIRPVPAYGDDPYAWLDAALAVYRSGGFDLLFPTQEQVAVLAASAALLDARGVVTAVPSFSALASVQDKCAAWSTLNRLGVPQPAAAIDPEDWTRFPAFVKQPVGTASGGVRRVTTPSELARVRAIWAGPVLVQSAVDGPLAMCQSVFDRGAMVAFHAALRTGEGANGGASHKQGVALPEARQLLEALGSALDWHGALSADVIMSGTGPLVIDVNPRLVEPENAWRSGVDLVGAVVASSRGDHPTRQPDGVAGTCTHQLLVAILGAAGRPDGRRAVANELVAAWRRSGRYRDSDEELTPVRGDPLAVVSAGLAAAATLVAPASRSWFTSGSVRSYALSPEGWARIRDEMAGEPQQTPTVS